MAIICQCRAVSERKVRRAVDHGARTLAEIGERCGAGTCCGGCHPSLLALLPDAGAAVGDVVLRPAT